MELGIDLRQPGQRSIGSLEPSHLWMLGLGPVEDGPAAEVGPHPYSFLADCECPGDCLRDHENE